MLISLKYLTIALIFANAAASGLRSGQAEPAGDYAGAKSVLGYKIEAKVFVHGNSVDFSTSGVEAIECKDQTFDIDAKGNVHISGVTTSGCIHDALAKDDLKLESVSYDGKKNTITVSIKQGHFFRTSMILKHVDAMLDATNAVQCSSADLALISKANFAADMKACGKKCWGAAACVTTCMAKTEGISAGCAACFGTEAQCARDHCMSACAFSPDSSACKSCAVKNCQQAETSCSGYSPAAIVASTMFA
eukprot:g142.t1